MAIYERPEETFVDVFGKTGRAVIAAMDEAGDDIANQRPRQKLGILGAGVNYRNVPVVLTDPLDSGSPAHIACDVRVLTEVPPLKRGIHMSRMSDCIARLSDLQFNDLQEYASALVERISACQYSGTTSAEVSGNYSYTELVPGRSPDKDKRSLETLSLRASLRQTRDDRVASAGFGFTNITACPCVQQTLKHASSGEAGDLPTLTHSQRCETSVSVEGIDGSLPLKEALETLDSIVVRTRNTLPREYEALLVHRAHRSPQFMEDVVRQVISGCFELLRDRFPESRLRVSSRCMESIHGFNISCELAYSISELKDMLMR